MALGVDPSDRVALPHRGALALLTSLRAAVFGATWLASYAGVAALLIKVITIESAKSLSFKRTMLERVDR